MNISYALFLQSKALKLTAKIVKITDIFITLRGCRMSLEDKISADYIEAMKARDSERSSTLSFLRAQVKNIKIDKRLEKVSDEDVIAIVKKQVKQRLESITQFKNGNRPELAAKEEAELAILKQYLPTEMSSEALSAVVAEVIKTTGANSIKDMGRVMKDVLAKTAGAADNQAVSAMVKELLAKA